MRALIRVKCCLVLFIRKFTGSGRVAWRERAGSFGAWDFVLRDVNFGLQ